MGMSSRTTRGQLLTGGSAFILSVAIAALLIVSPARAGRGGPCWGSVTIYLDGTQAAKPVCHSNGCLPCGPATGVPLNGKFAYVCLCPNINPQARCDVATWVDGTLGTQCFNPTCGSPTQICIGDVIPNPDTPPTTMGEAHCECNGP